MLISRSEYEQFIYTIMETYPSVRASTLYFITTSAQAGLLKGTLSFEQDIELRVVEVVDFAMGEILDYSYTVYKGNEKLYWYDPQGHPGDSILGATYPHHKHVPPDIKRHRLPAPRLSFSESNLPFLIEEINTVLLDY